MDDGADDAVEEAEDDDEDNKDNGEEMHDASLLDVMDKSSGLSGNMTIVPYMDLGLLLNNGVYHELYTNDQ